MACFNFNDFFNLLKKYFTVIFFFLAILLSIFLIFMNSNSVSAYTINYGRNGSAFASSEIDAIENYFNTNMSDTYDYWAYYWAYPDADAYVVFFNTLGDENFYSITEHVPGQGWDNYYINSFSNISGVVYTAPYGIVGSLVQTLNNQFFDARYSYTNNKPHFYGNVSILESQNSSNYIWETDIPVSHFVAPALYPPADSQQNSNLVSGQFTFFVVTPGSLTASQEILMEVYNTTYADSADTIVQTYHLNSSSPFYEEGSNDFEYVLTARFLDWFQVVNGNSYKIRLSWVNPSNPLGVDSITYSWTMNLTATEQENESLKVQQEMNSTMQNINNSINETNSFLTSDYYNENTVIDGMGNIYSQELDNVPYDNMLGALFDNLKNAFTNTNPIDFEFVIPFSNGQKITIPSDYISSHVPSVILGIIRVFYWYIIARYIFKDAWHTIDKIRQGSYFYSAEQDIKTEVL